MAAHVGIDTLIGALPLIGDLFDFAWKSNARNVRLLARHVDAPVETRRASTALLVAVLGTLALIAVGASVLAIYVIRRLIGCRRSALSPVRPCRHVMLLPATVA